MTPAEKANLNDYYNRILTSLRSHLARGAEMQIHQSMEMDHHMDVLDGLIGMIHTVVDKLDRIEDARS